MAEKILVCGARGYVGRHLVADLVKKGHEVVAHSREMGDLLDSDFCRTICRGVDWIYNLAATVGGIGFIGVNKASCMSSAAININLLRARPPGLKGYFFASSSCVYSNSSVPAVEDRVYPGDLTGYGLEKHYSEQVCKSFYEEHGVPVRIARLHTVYGPGDFRGKGRDHFPTALTEQAAEAVYTKIPEMKIWGDGEQTRSLLYIDDAVEGIQRIMGAGISDPVNLASSEPVSVKGIVSMLEDITATKFNLFHSLDSPTGAQHKNTDNTRLRNRLGWEPMTPTRTGIERLYRSCWERLLRSK